MIDTNSDWISLNDAATHVAERLPCYRDHAFELVLRAARDLRLKSRTINGPPRWIVSVVAGEERFHSDSGARIEVCREDLLKLWPEHQKDAMQSFRPQIGSNATQQRCRPISNGVQLAIDFLWPNGIPQIVSLGVV